MVTAQRAFLKKLIKYRLATSSATFSQGATVAIQRMQAQWRIKPSNSSRKTVKATKK